ncbi:glycosyltransferase family 2 protein [Rhodobacteraceae bacterium B1Z28]|uniref:Glycosyltransferase family 2 protein n=1 Tax=Ruegeria haliotis TaxID=2747601 RepID=A0ABX2PP98_9RHOB|nr:glycosyltransferase family 2 protein [Ruegeria haliotis]NVO55960.1 glycosyltransferase family 2 protein [Ruegeria haliotis]
MLPQIGWAQKYRLRWKRRRLLWQSLRSRHQLTSLNDRTDKIRRGDILAFTTLRNEITRLPWFFRHYRQLGVDHFLIVDNGSDDRSTEYLLDQPDVSLWQTHASYRASRYGLDWLTWLQMRYGHRHWSLMVDADELLIYAHHDTRPLQDLTTWLDQQGSAGFGALMLDLYPKGPLGTQSYDPDTDPTEVLNWFDAEPYRAQRQHPVGNLWVQGGARERLFFAQIRQRSPTLNKIPLVRWSRHYAYVNSCHSALPRYLNTAYDGPGGAAPSGVLLHTKFLPEIVEKSKIEKTRRQHFHDPDQFGSYYEGIINRPDMWTPQSTRYAGWAQLQKLGLMNAIGWDGLYNT